MTRRILHVVGTLNRGGAETWLVQVVRRLCGPGLAMDFLVQSDRPGAYEGEIRALGGRVVAGAGRKPRRVFARNFARALAEHGPYAAVHSHLGYYSGFVLGLARRHGVPVRIVHSRNDVSLKDAEAGALRRAYCALMKQAIRRHATLGLAVSARAAAALFGPGWQVDPRWQVLHSGIDLAPFAAPVDKAALRAELGLPADAVVVGHVGRFHVQKNHAFLIELFARIAAGEPRTRLLLVGEGELRQEIEGRLRATGLRERAVLTGARSDVPRLMLGAMDILVLPSRWEGLPLVLLEAQAAGLPAVVSDVVSAEADVVPALVRRLPLHASAEDWAETALQAAAMPAQVRATGFERMQASPFEIGASIARLARVYAAQGLGAAGSADDPSAAA